MKRKYSIFVGVVALGLAFEPAAAFAHAGGGGGGRGGSHGGGSHGGGGRGGFHGFDRGRVFVGPGGFVGYGPGYPYYPYYPAYCSRFHFIYDPAYGCDRY
jgi:hypothetical protein